LIAELPVARKSSDKPERKSSESRKHGTLVRLADDVVEDARVLGSMLGLSMAELISDEVRPIIKKRLEAEMRKRLGEKK
jgi:hypothetical protein